jgi:rhamnosyltransferase
MISTAINKELVSKMSCAIVIYNSAIETSKAFISLSAAALEADITEPIDLIVYDNSPIPLYDVNLKLANWNVTYVYDQTNPGLSKASNEAFLIAKKSYKKWILFSNPDTDYTSDYFIKLYQAVRENPEANLIVPVLLSNNYIVSPCKYILMRASIAQHVVTGWNDYKRKTLLYSGAFITMDSFEKIGMFKAEIKLDYMDSHFFDKYKKLYPNFYVLDCYCEHDLSSFELNKDKVARRHVYFCDGARASSESVKEYLLIGSLCLGYSAKLALRFKDSVFLKIFFSSYAKKIKL